MPWLKGTQVEWIAPPLGDQPVEVKRVTLYKIDMMKLSDPEGGYNRDEDGWPPPVAKCTQPELAYGWRPHFGIYGQWEAEWKKRANKDNVAVSWASPWIIFAKPYGVTEPCFRKAWERFIAPVVGGMGVKEGADGLLRAYVQAMGAEPMPAFYAEMLKGMRCRVEIVESVGDNVTYYNVAYAGPDPKIYSDPDQAEHNLALLKQRLGKEKREERTQLTTALLKDLLAVAELLENAELRDEAIFRAECYTVSGGRTEFFGELTQGEAEGMLVAYKSLWEDFEKKDKGAEPPITESQKRQVSALFREVTVKQDGRGPAMTVDQALDSVKDILGPEADARKDRAGGYYIDALTSKEAEQVLKQWRLELKKLEEQEEGQEEIPF